MSASRAKQGYARHGDELTNELVEWFNQVDATYRGQLKELNELNFARFDARLCSEIDRAIHRLEARMATFETRVTRWMFVFWVGSLGTCIALIQLAR